MKRLIRRFLNKLATNKYLRQQVEKQGVFPAGHYYSPIPDKDDVGAYVKSRKPPPTELPDINLNAKSQFELLIKYAGFYDELPFPEAKEKDFRYYYHNDFYSYGDAIILYSFLRKHQPKKIIEIGSGFSSAVILDTVDRFFTRRPEITFVEPYPDRLKSILKRDDESQIRILNKKIQEVSPVLFSSLESGDLLFIDSSHVVKCGSDLQLLFFDILPFLPDGIFLHFHDVFYPFEYPSSWLMNGRYWNENYFLRTFLAYNSEWSIYFFNAYAAFAFNEYIKDKMPLCFMNPGGSLYIQKRVKNLQNI